ncbi:MAG TPA: hypothetical protein VGF94_07545 [Kofleriaceae bacterium]|jgi:hypothetical protein
MSEPALRAALRPSSRRDQHILLAAGAMTLPISVAAVHSHAPVATIVTWFIGCAVMAAVARAWYRWRARVRDQLVAAIEGGAVVTEIVIARFSINYIIPFGYGVSFHAGTHKNLTFGFWKRAAADHFVAVLNGAAAAPLPRARVV